MFHNTYSQMKMVADACKRDVQKMAEETNPEQAAIFKEETKNIVATLEDLCQRRPRLSKEERDTALFIMSKAKKFEETDGEVSESEVDEVMDLLRNYIGGSDLTEEMAKGA